MIYYRVKEHYDNFPKGNGDILIGNELYTITEYEELGLSSQLFELVSIPKEKTYFFFGARFEYQKG